MANLVSRSSVNFNSIATAIRQSGQNIENLMKRFAKAAQSGNQGEMAYLQAKLQQEHTRFNALQAVLSLLSNIVKTISDAIRALAR